MFEITKPEEINAIKSPRIRLYLKRRLREIGYTLNPLSEGSFLYVDDPELLYQSHRLIAVNLSSIEQGLFSKIETTVVHLGIIEVTLLYNNEYTLSIVLECKRCSTHLLTLLDIKDSCEE